MRVVRRMDAIKYAVVILATALMAIAPGPASAQDAHWVEGPAGGHWIGNPTPAHYIGRHAAGALVDAARLGVVGPKLEAKIAQARARFFAPGLSAAQRKAAGDEFGELLWSKDMIYAGMYLSEGFNKHAEAAVAVTAKLAHPGSKGIPALLDGGFPGTSWDYFTIWIRAVRETMGAHNDGNLLFLVDEAALKRAMLANADAYIAYRVERDKGEFDEWADRQKPQAAPVSAPAKGPNRTVKECSDEAEALKVVNYLRQTHLQRCLTGYRFTSAEQVQAINNEKLLEMGRQINAKRR
jgi:hypothetical protein